MNAINHAATALLVQKRWPAIPLLAALLSVQLIELLWVAFNLLGIESTQMAPQVQSLADIQLAHMPFSHSVAATLLIALLAWFVLRRTGASAAWAWAFAVGVCSHIVLDIATHAPDIEIMPFLGWPKIGSGLYEAPALALLVETAYGIGCWWFFNGSRALLAVIVGFNLATLSFYLPQVNGPEILLAGHPQAFAWVILLHIIAGLVAVGLFARTAPETRQ